MQYAARGFPAELVALNNASAALATRHQGLFRIEHLDNPVAVSAVHPDLTDQRSQLLQKLTFPVGYRDPEEKESV
jgi:hypothetical protein